MDSRFVQPFEKLAQALRIKKHAVWDKENNALRPRRRQRRDEGPFAWRQTDASTSWI